MSKFKIMPFAKQVLKNFVSKPATTSYPFKPRVYPERTRGHVDIDINECILCGMCMRSCPPGAITVDRNASTWTINRFDCIQCGYCVLKCPKKCLTLTPGYQEPGEKKFTDTRTKPVDETPKPAAAPAAAANAAPAAVAAPATPAANA